MLENFKQLIYDKNKDFPWQSFENETIIIDPESNQSFELNELGTFIWNQLDGKKKVADIVEAIMREYETDDAQVLADLQALIESMQEAKLIIGKSE